MHSQSAMPTHVQMHKQVSEVNASRHISKGSEILQPCSGDAAGRRLAALVVVVVVLHHLLLVVVFLLLLVVVHLVVVAVELVVVVVVVVVVVAGEVHGVVGKRVDRTLRLPLCLMSLCTKRLMAWHGGKSTPPKPSSTSNSVAVSVDGVVVVAVVVGTSRPQ